MFLQYSDNYHLCKDSENYKMMQAAAAQQSFKLMECSTRSFLGLLKSYRNGDIDRQSLPGDLPKDGLFLIAFSENAFTSHSGMVHLDISRAISKEFPDAHRQLIFKRPKPLEGKTVQEIHIPHIYEGLYFKIKHCYEKVTKL
jgi:hypothetical protein